MLSSASLCGLADGGLGMVWSGCPVCLRSGESGDLGWGFGSTWGHSVTEETALLLLAGAEYLCVGPRQPL